MFKIKKLPSRYVRQSHFLMATDRMSRDGYHVLDSFEI